MFNKEERKMTICDYVDWFDFSLYHTKDEYGDKCYKLYDNQGANWGNIEEDEHNNFASVIDRLDTYFEDYIDENLYDDLKVYQDKDEHVDLAFDAMHHNRGYEEVLNELCQASEECQEYYKGYMYMLYYTLHPEELIDDTLSEEEFFN